MATPTSLAAVRENFVNHIQRLVSYMDGRAKEGTNTGSSSFYQPPASDWSGDLFDLEGMAKAFSRVAQYIDFETVAKETGVKADHIMTLLQGDFIACLERAYRERHKSAVRTRIHAAARHRGHAYPTGVLTRGIQGFLEGIEKQAKSNQGAAGGTT